MAHVVMFGAFFAEHRFTALQQISISTVAIVSSYNLSLIDIVGIVWGD